jgi:hypothetical protein
VSRLPLGACAVHGRAPAPVRHRARPQSALRVSAVEMRASASATRAAPV